MNGFSNSAPLFLPPGDKIDATRFEGWTFYLQQEGFKLLCDGSEVGLMKEEEEQGPLGAPEYIAAAVLESGREYRIVLDDACPALNMEEGAMGFSLVSSCLEHGGKVPRSRGTHIRVLPPPPALAQINKSRFPKLSALCMRIVLRAQPDVKALHIPKELKEQLNSKQSEIGSNWFKYSFSAQFLKN